MKQRTLCFILAVCMFLTTGCWDKTELNDLALLMGWGMDITEDGQFLASAQFVIPSRAASSGQSPGGQAGQAFFTMTAPGKTILDAAQNMQTQVSRRIFSGHRREIFIGEALARHGLRHVLDEYSRNPEVRLRADAFVVKGGTARDFLSVQQPLGKIPALAALKLHQSLGAEADVSLLNFLIDSSTVGSAPTLPVMQTVSTSPTADPEQGDKSVPRGYQYAGRAIFDKNLKLVGYLNSLESQYAFWVKGQLRFGTLTGLIPKENGNVSVTLTKLNGKIHPVLQGNRIRMFIVLTGTGPIRENETELDLSQAKNLDLVRSALEQQVKQEAEQVISKVQTQYDADIFGFGGAIHRKYPIRWKSLQKRWDTEFPKVEVMVHVNLSIPRVGLSRPSLELKDTEVHK